MIDGFLDQETSSVAQNAHVVPFDEKGFDANALKHALALLNTDTFFGCVYGSGIEGNPKLIEIIQEKMPVLGNTVEAVFNVKNHATFFSTLATLTIPYPKIFNAFPKNHTGKLLIKSVQGAGGQHIRFAAPNAPLEAHEYLQALVEGTPVSVLFLVEKNAQIKAHVIGFNLQWTSPTDTQPFRFGGIASHVDLTESIKNLLGEIVQKLAKAFKLVGLNSLDVIISDEKIFVLEINPRLSASVDLYAQTLLEQYDLDLMALHIQCCLGESLPEATTKQLAEWSKINHSTAMSVVYADQDIVLEMIDWPDWVNDRSDLGVKILKESPICSVISRENSALLAESLAKFRVNFVKTMLDIVR